MPAVAVGKANSVAHWLRWVINIGVALVAPEPCYDHSTCKQKDCSDVAYRSPFQLQRCRHQVALQLSQHAHVDIMCSLLICVHQ